MQCTIDFKGLARDNLIIEHRDKGYPHETTPHTALGQLLASYNGMEQAEYILMVFSILRFEFISISLISEYCSQSYQEQWLQSSK